MLGRGVRIPALLSCSGSVLGSCRGSDTHAPGLSCCGSVRSRVRSGRALLCPCVLWFVRHAVRVRPRAFSLICPTCVFSLPSSFAPFIISLCLQSHASSSSMLPCLKSCLALPCQSVFPYGVVFVVYFIFFINKALLPPAIESSLYPFTHP